MTIEAPASIAAAATAALAVSIDSLTPRPEPASSWSTGTVRRSSSAAATGSAPGRVDSPPTSRISAPSPASTRACSSAAAGVGKRPPSENESGVTLMIPISRYGATPGTLPLERAGRGRGRAGATVAGRRAVVPASRRPLRPRLERFRRLLVVRVHLGGAARQAGTGQRPWRLALGGPLADRLGR